MGRISNEKIIDSIDLTDEKEYQKKGVSLSTINVYPLLDAQLEACQQEHERVVREIFETLENWGVKFTAKFKSKYIEGK